MAYERAMAAMFRMNEQTWARHANPWSVWTRNTALPLLVVAIWSRVWLGWWALVPLALALLWTWLNPRLFPVPASTRNWASKAVLGERVWLNRRQVPIPAHHSRALHLLSAIAALGLPFLAWGLYNLQLWPTLLGSVLIYAGKLWFLDRMVWLYQDMCELHPEYRRWLY
ncbi:hypothetical protein DU505_13730 [Billgrantia montanilacus]|uniref:Uncharacterized protein n=2 Tax=Billgrantia montanilacus TaxID=2282305 RepID=A0A368TU87_9GAMM|nr:hypothetical protein DU505_13730 [Halomonas montanilacus]